MKTTIEATSPALIAPCGINCRLCRAYSRDVNRCPGCRGDDALKMKSCVSCRMKNCEKLAAGGFQFCFECESFPCARLSHLDKRYRTKYGNSPIANLLFIEARGVRTFVRNEDKKWKCPQCGAMIC